MQTKQRFVLDTTALTSVELRNDGEDLCLASKRILGLISRSRTKLNISCHIPYPTVYDEIAHFLKRYKCDQEVLIAVDTWLVKKTPNRFDVKIPAELFYEYVKDMRERMNKGMKVGESAIWLSAAEAANLTRREVDKEKINRESTGLLIKDYRSKYRNALRYATLDSAPDLDVLLLAKEMDAGVVASDEGIKKWAEKLGLRFVEGHSFPMMLEEYLKHFD